MAASSTDAPQQAETTDWIDQFCSAGSPKPLRTAAALALRAENKIIQILIHRVIHSVIHFIEQTQGTNLSSVPQTTKLTLTQSFYIANNTIHQTLMRPRRWHPHEGTILQTVSMVKIHWIKVGIHVAGLVASFNLTMN